MTSTDRILALMQLADEIKRPHDIYSRAVRRAAQASSNSPQYDAAVARGNAALLVIEKAVRDWVAKHPDPMHTAAAKAVVLREAADICDEAGGAYAGRALNDHAAGAFDLMEHFLRKANEAEYVATPCDPMVPCEDGGEPCHTHERLMAHAEGEHELCGDECTAPHRLAPAVLPPSA